ncbi:MAG TPA: RND transporter, partial [Paralcaligenes sp.]
MEYRQYRQYRPVATAITAATFSVTLAACAVGPDYRTPAPPAGDRVTAEPMPEQTVAAPGPAGAAQRFVAQHDIPGQWWALFHCAPLNALIHEALSNSPTLVAARAVLRQA